jgi:hypothetical protein
MHWSAEEIQKNPRCTQRMKHFLAPKVLSDKRPKIYKAFVDACGTESGARKALTWGNSPAVSVDPRWLIPAPGGGAMCGATRGERIDPRNIWIATSRVMPLEKCIAEVDILNNTKRFESTVLHELVHYVRNAANLNEADWDNFPDSPTEAGIQFEIWAYGALTCTIDDDRDAAASYM